MNFDVENRVEPVQVALYRPEIPQNTGNIGRLCVGFGVKLSLLGELGFEITNSRLKRAGLDYWQHLEWEHELDPELWAKNNSDREIICLSKIGEENIYDFPFKPGSILLFGRETTGIPLSFSNKLNLKRVRIPVLGNIRSYNLANSVAMTLSESYRQLGWGKEVRLTLEKDS